MIVHDRDLVGTISLPPEADAPLIIDAYAVLALSLPGQEFKSVAGRNS
jgi:hypothetical protein